MRELPSRPAPAGITPTAVGGVAPARQLDRPALGYALTMLAMFGFASMDAVSKLIVQDYAIAQALWIRYLVFTLVAMMIIRPARVWQAVRTTRPLLQAGRALLQLVEAAVFILAFRYLPLADTHAIAAASPLVVVALSVPLLGERVGPRRWTAVGAGFVGVLVIVRPGFQTLDWPLLLPVLGAFMWGYYQILVRLCSRTDSSETSLLWSAVVGSLAMTFVGPWYWQWPDLQGWSFLVALGVLGTVSHLALLKALEFAEAGAVQPFSYLLLVWATMLGYLVFGDIPDHWTVAGAAVILASGLYTWYRERSAPS